jgi:polyisoprenyl-phosphate glycosyltransferase
MSDSPSPSEAQPVLSIVIPLLNEEAVVERTYQRLKTHLDKLGESYELVFVDDGSKDQSRAILAAKAMVDPTVRVIGLSRNFGHEMATTAGLQSARGQAAIVMDADLQDPPELIEQFLAKWREGYQVVFGIRRERRGETILKRITSFVFYRLLRQLADVAIPADTGDFRLLDRRVLEVYRQFQEEPRFFRGLISWIGFRQIGIPFVRACRAGGQTKYRYGRLLRLALDTFTAFSTLPALCLTLLAGGMAAASFLLLLAIVLLWSLSAITVASWGWAALGFLVLWNVQFLGMAILGEYVVRTHRNSLRRPLFVVDSVIEFRPPAQVNRLLPSTELAETIVCHPSALCQS